MQCTSPVYLSFRKKRRWDGPHGSKCLLWCPEVFKTGVRSKWVLGRCRKQAHCVKLHHVQKQTSLSSQGHLVHWPAQTQRSEDGRGYDGSGASVPAETVPQSRRRPEGQRSQPTAQRVSWAELPRTQQTHTEPYIFKSLESFLRRGTCDLRNSALSFCTAV